MISKAAVEQAAREVEIAKRNMGAARDAWWATRTQDAARDAVLALSLAGQRVTAAVAAHSAAVAELDALRAAIARRR